MAAALMLPPCTWPNDAVIVWRRGKLHRQMCNTALAHRDFLKVLELRPDSKMAKEEVTVACSHLNCSADLPGPIWCHHVHHLSPQLDKSDRLEQLLTDVEAKFASADQSGIQDDIQAIYDLAQDCVKVRQ